MATYKAEFLSHYYARPAAAAAGLRARPDPLGARLAVARAAARQPAAAARAVCAVGKRLAGVAPRAHAAARSRRRRSRDWFARAAEPPAARRTPRVMLWPDTFNDHFHPEVAIAAAEVLEAAGFEVVRAAARRCAAGGRSTTTGC